jgi:hypothetical protein
MNTAYESTSSGTLAIQRLNCAYLAPVDQPDPERLRRRIDDVVRSRLAPLFARALAQTLDAGDESVWLIRRLEVDLAVDMGALDDHALARAWTQQIAVRLARVITSGGDGEDILHFPNRAAYLAQFGRDLARGSAWSKWYYAEFDTLRLLPEGTAFVEALLRRPEVGAQALRALAQGSDFERVLGMLSARQAERLLDGLIPSGASHDSRTSAEQVLQAWDAARLMRPIDTPHNRLRLLASMLMNAPGFNVDASLHDSLIALTEVAGVLERSAGSLRRLIDWVTTQEGTPLASNLSSDTAEWLAQAAQGDANWLLNAAKVLAPAAAADVSGAAPSAARASTLITHFGGLMHLLGIWVELDVPGAIDLACAGAAEDERPRLSEALRLGLALRCLEPENAIDLLSDEGALLALGIGAPFSMEELRRTLSRPLRLTEMTRHVVEQLIQRGECDPGRAVTDVTPDAVITRDAETGYWLDVVIRNPVSEPAESLQNLRGLGDPGGLLPLHLSLLAHNTLRRLARSMRGFENSSAAYVRTNFLASIATLSLNNDALRAQLTQPPLGMLLRLAGLGEYRYALPWWPGREIHVEMELPL